MSRAQFVRRGALLIGLVGLSSGGAALAGDEAPPDLDQEVLDALRAEIPEGFPGEWDLTEADEEYGRLVALFAQSTDVANFGTGSELSGPCGGVAYSFDEQGTLIDAAVDIGDGGPPFDPLEGTQAFTSGNPFKVDPRGLVQYYGFSPRVGDGPRDHSWFIKTSGISLDEGGDPNNDAKNRNAGIVDLDKDLPVKFSAKVKMEAQMDSENLPTCFGQGHVEFVGNGLTDPVGLAGLALLVGGIFGLLFNARPARTWKV